MKQNADLNEIVDFICLDNPLAAIDLSELLFETAEKIGNMPYMGKNGRVKWHTRICRTPQIHFGLSSATERSFDFACFAHLQKISLNFSNLGIFCFLKRKNHENLHRNRSRQARPNPTIWIAKKKA